MVRRSRSPPPYHDYRDSRDSTRYARRVDRRRGIDEDNRGIGRLERPRYEGSDHHGRRERDGRMSWYDDERRGREPSPTGRRDVRERSRDRDRDRQRGGEPEDRRRRTDRRSVSPPPRATGSRLHTSSAQGRSTSPVDKTKPNFNPSGLLAAATNTVHSVDGTSTVLKYNEPPEARKPTLGWRLYVFKGSEQVELLHIHRQSAYLIGRDRAVADISIDHPSCSKQHAAIQYRHVQEKDEHGSSKGVVKPFIIDLESTNGTHVNDEAIPVSRFYELKASDVIKFGLSTREYVLLHDEAQ